MSEMYLGTGPSQKGADLSQDVGAASQAGIGPTPTQHEYSTARERRPQADSIPDEHMDEDNGEQWLTQPSQTDAEPSRHDCSDGTWLHALSSEVCKEGEAWYTQSAGQAGTGSVMPLLDTGLACCDDEAAEQQQDRQQLKKQRLSQMPALVYPPVDNAVSEQVAHQPPASSTKGALAAPCQGSKATKGTARGQRGALLLQQQGLQGRAQTGGRPGCSPC